MRADGLSDPDAFADELMAQHARHYADNPTGEILPMCMIVEADGNVGTVSIAWRDAAQRAVMIAALRVFMAEVGAVRYAIWAEAWTLSTTHEGVKELEEDRAEGRYLDLGEHPDRVEVVTTLVVDAYRSKPVFRQQVIKRDGRGWVVELAPDTDPPTGLLGGDLTTLLPRRAYQ
jgi:hypothetical protein